MFSLSNNFQIPNNQTLLSYYHQKNPFCLSLLFNLITFDYFKQIIYILNDLRIDRNFALAPAKEKRSNRPTADVLLHLLHAGHHILHQLHHALHISQTSLVFPNVALLRQPLPMVSQVSHRYL